MAGAAPDPRAASDPRASHDDGRPHGGRGIFEALLLAAVPIAMWRCARGWFCTDRAADDAGGHGGFGAVLCGLRGEQAGAPPDYAHARACRPCCGGTHPVCADSGFQACFGHCNHRRSDAGAAQRVHGGCVGGVREQLLFWARVVESLADVRLGADWISGRCPCRQGGFPRCVRFPRAPR